MTKTIVEHLQKSSAQVCASIMTDLRVGLSEFDIANLIRLEFQKLGIKDFWYDVPQNVLIGTERFKIGTTTSDYAVKMPSDKVALVAGSPVFIDLAPMDSGTKQWGDWATTFIFQPRPGIDDEQQAFLKEMKQVHHTGLSQINSRSTGADICSHYLEEFALRNITPLDVRKNVGHSIHQGPKNQAKRIWLDETNAGPLGEGIYAVEPGGFRPKSDGSDIVVGRFEECIYIPKEGNAVLLGNYDHAGPSI